MITAQEAKLKSESAREEKRNPANILNKIEAEIIEACGKGYNHVDLGFVLSLPKPVTDELKTAGYKIKTVNAINRRSYLHFIISW